MPKDRSHSCLSSDRSRASPYSRTSKNAEQCGSKSTLPSVGDEGEWNDTRCVICMEHPHNAVLLLCSSHEKGCRPYMCDTSDRHSNCFDQFHKTSPSIQTSDPVVDFSCSYRFNKLENKLTCPLCRGQISGWMVVEDARSFMNSKSRDCSLESCSFVGTYQELRKHARCEHPLLRPTEADPRRQEQWTRMENERTLEDFLGVSEHGNDLIDLEDLFLSDDDSNLLFFSQLEPEGDLDDVLGVGSFPFFSQFEPEVERGIMDMNFELELPFSFREMRFRWGDPYHSSVHDSPQWSYRSRNRELNRLMSQPVNSTGGYSFGRSSPNRGWPRQHSAGHDAYGSQYGWFPLMDAFGGQDGYGVFSSEKHASTPAAYRREGSTTQMFPAANGRTAGSIVSGGSGGYYGNPPMTQFWVSPYGSPLLPGSPVAAGANTPGRRNELWFSQGVSNRNVGAYTGWHGERGVDSSDDPQKKHSILDELKSCSARKIDLSDIAGRIVEFSIDQHGSRFIQQKLESCEVEERESVFREILPLAPKLMTDVLGNYVIQKFFEHGSREQWKQLADQLSGQILPLTLQMYGCRVIHKVLEVIELDQKTELVHELDGHVLRCAQDQNGNHVIRKCIECIPTGKIGFIISSFRGQVANLSIHPYGCRVIQRVLEHCGDELQSQCIVDEILGSAHILAQDQYGNYVTQRGKPHERSQIISKLTGRLLQMSQHKYASNVIEKCLEHGDVAERECLIEEILGQSDENNNLLTMMKDRFANYVVQKILETSNDKQQEVLLIGSM